MTKNKQNWLSDERLILISSGKQWDFHGGIYPSENKNQSNQRPIEDAGIPPFLIIPIEYKGEVANLEVKVGDSVLKGQLLTCSSSNSPMVHASSSGVVHAIEHHPELHPAGYSILCIVIKTDGFDRVSENASLFFDNIVTDSPRKSPKTNSDVTPASTEINDLVNIQKEDAVAYIKQAGIIGLGGAGFPTHLKLRPPKKTELLVINAIECEPYITADESLILEKTEEILQGVNLLQQILSPAVTIIAIEDNKPEAILTIKRALALEKHAQENTLETPSNNYQNIVVRTVPTRYPSGSEKQLIEILTGQQIPKNKHPTDVGIVIQNVGTVFAIKEALIDGTALISRVLTLTGNAFPKPLNINVRIGTPIKYLLERYKLDSSLVTKLIIGGPMMGFTLTNTGAAVSKTTNCILAPTLQELPIESVESPCIRCNECALVCPSRLLPQQLLWYAKEKNYKKLEQYDLNACIECGACAFVCPSKIPLVNYYRIAKSENAALQIEASKANVARIRHDNKTKRLDEIKKERQKKHKEAAEKRKQAMSTPNANQDLIAAAIARAQAKKRAQEDKP